jgi:hypothetical protein
MEKSIGVYEDAGSPVNAQPGDPEQERAHNPLGPPLPPPDPMRHELRQIFHQLIRTNNYLSEVVLEDRQWRDNRDRRGSRVKKYHQRDSDDDLEKGKTPGSRRALSPANVPLPRSPSDSTSLSETPITLSSSEYDDSGGSSSLSESGEGLYVSLPARRSGRPRRKVYVIPSRHRPSRALVRPTPPPPNLQHRAVRIITPEGSPHLCTAPAPIGAFESISKAEGLAEHAIRRRKLNGIS